MEMPSRLLRFAGYLRHVLQTASPAPVSAVIVAAFVASWGEAHDAW
jgi:hypothetical protein